MSHLKVNIRMRPTDYAELFIRIIINCKWIYYIRSILTKWKIQFENQNFSQKELGTAIKLLLLIIGLKLSLVTVFAKTFIPSIILGETE